MDYYQHHIVQAHLKVCGTMEVCTKNSGKTYRDFQQKHTDATEHAYSVEYIVD